MPAISANDTALRFNRGKYEGEHMHRVACRDPGYILWCWEKSKSADKMGITESLYHLAITRMPKDDRSIVSRAYLADRQKDARMQAYMNQQLEVVDHSVVVMGEDGETRVEQRGPAHPNCRSVAYPVHLAGEWGPEAPEEPSFLDELAAPEEIKAESFLDGIL